jgi:hypothetical protein
MQQVQVQVLAKFYTPLPDLCNIPTLIRLLNVLWNTFGIHYWSLSPLGCSIGSTWGFVSILAIQIGLKSSSISRKTIKYPTWQSHPTQNEGVGLSLYCLMKRSILYIFLLEMAIILKTVFHYLQDLAGRPKSVLQGF